MEKDQNETEVKEPTVNDKTINNESDQVIYPLKPDAETQVESSKVYLTDEEVKEWQMLDRQMQVLSMKKQELSDFETTISKTKKKSKSLKKDIIRNESDIELFDIKFKSKLQIKYGNFKIGENNEVIKVGY